MQFDTTRRSLLTAATAVMLSACGGNSGSSSTSSSAGDTASTPVIASAAIYLTTPDQSSLVARQADLPFGTSGQSGTVINVDTGTRYQSMLGFGAALTDASVHVIDTHLDASARAALIAELFGPTGLNLSYARLTIGASDFSLSHYSYDDLPAGQTDASLAHFSIAPAEAGLIPLLHAAMARNASLKFMASPWSAPGWMKTSGSLVGGGLRTDQYPAYAAYLVRYVQAFAADGVPIDAISVANEPANSPSDYPGMLLTASERAAFIGGHLGPLASRSGLAVKILDWDHNWDQPAEPLAVLADPVAAPYVSGTAWHCYAGEPSAQSSVHAAHPGVDTYFTECSGGDWAPGWASSFSWNMRQLVIGATRNWARTVLLWNLALDEQHGPHTGGCSNCRPVVSIDSATGAVTRNLEYYVLAQVSPFVRPGAVRIATDSGVDGLETVGFLNADDGSVALIVVNTSEAARSFDVRQPGRSLPCTLPAGATATIVW